MTKIVVGTRGTLAVKERMVRDVSGGYPRNYYHKFTKRKRRQKISKPISGIQNLIKGLS